MRSYGELLKGKTIDSSQQLSRISLTLQKKNWNKTLPSPSGSSDIQYSTEGLLVQPGKHFYFTLHRPSIESYCKALRLSHMGLFKLQLLPTECSLCLLHCCFSEVDWMLSGWQPLSVFALANCLTHSNSFWALALAQGLMVVLHQRIKSNDFRHKNNV